MTIQDWTRVSHWLPSYRPGRHGVKVFLDDDVSGMLENFKKRNIPTKVIEQGRRRAVFIPKMWGNLFNLNHQEESDG